MHALTCIQIATCQKHGKLIALNFNIKRKRALGDACMKSNTALAPCMAIAIVLLTLNNANYLLIASRLGLANQYHHCGFGPTLNCV